MHRIHTLVFGALALTVACSGEKDTDVVAATGETGIVADTDTDTDVDTDTDTDVDTDADPTYDGDIAPLIGSSCAGVGCHTNGGQSGGLNLDDGYDTLLNDVSSTGVDYVVPGDTDNSYLWQKLNGTGSGSQMPLGAPLAQSQLDLIEAWILDGAPEN